MAVRTGTANPKWLLSDHLGSQAITASYDGLTEEGEVRYKAWGEDRYTSGTTPTSFRYTGQRSEMGTIGLYFYGAQFYDPVLSRFTSADSIIPDAGSVQAWDRYAYANKNPVKYIDPTGHGSNAVVMHDSDGDSPCNDPNHCLDTSGNLKVKEPASSNNPINILTTSDQGTQSPPKIWSDNFLYSACPAGATDCIGRYLKYFSLTGGTTIPVLGTVFGWHASITLDQYGHFYLGGGFDMGKNITGVNISLVEGRFTSSQLPEDDYQEMITLENHLSGLAFQGFIVPVLYIGGDWSPNTNLGSEEVGIGWPQAGVAGTYSWLLNK